MSFFLYHQQLLIHLKPPTQCRTHHLLKKSHQQRFVSWVATHNRLTSVKRGESIVPVADAAADDNGIETLWSLPEIRIGVKTPVFPSIKIRRQQLHRFIVSFCFTTGALLGALLVIIESFKRIVGVLLVSPHTF